MDYILVSKKEHVETVIVTTLIIDIGYNNIQQQLLKAEMFVAGSMSPTRGRHVYSKVNYW